MEQGGARSIINLAFGQGPRVFVSAGCSQATDIDLEVTDQDTKQAIVVDKQPDATPVGLATTGAKTLYTVCTSLPESRGAALTLTGILKVEAGGAARRSGRRWVVTEWGWGGVQEENRSRRPGYVWKGIWSFPRCWVRTVRTRCVDLPVGVHASACPRWSSRFSVQAVEDRPGQNTLKRELQHEFRTPMVAPTRTSGCVIP